jgi:hypothetical protein
VSTTAVFAEILLIGFLALGSYGAVAVAAAGLPAEVISRLKDWTALSTLVVTALAYPIGLSLDRISDSLAERVEGRLWSLSLEVDEPEMRFRVWGASPGRVVEFLDYARSRRRVARSTALISGSVALIAIGVAIPLLAMHSDHGWWELVLAGGSVVIFGGAGYAWWRIGVMYYARLQLAYRLDVLELGEGAGKGLRG